MYELEQKLQLPYALTAAKFSALIQYDIVLTPTGMSLYFLN